MTSTKMGLCTRKSLASTRQRCSVLRLKILSKNMIPQRFDNILSAWSMNLNIIEWSTLHTILIWMSCYVVIKLNEINVHKLCFWYLKPSASILHLKWPIFLSADVVPSTLFPSHTVIHFQETCQCFPGLPINCQLFIFEWWMLRHLLLYTVPLFPANVPVPAIPSCPCCSG